VLDLLPSGLTVFSFVMFITAKDDEHEEAIHRMTSQYQAGIGKSSSVDTASS